MRAVTDGTDLTVTDGFVIGGDSAEPRDHTTAGWREALESKRRLFWSSLSPSPSWPVYGEELDG